MRFLLLIPLFYAIARWVKHRDDVRAARERSAYLERFRRPGVTRYGPMRK